MRELVDIRQRKHDQVLRREDIVVLICDDASDKKCEFLKIDRLPETAELRPKSKISGNFLRQIKDGTLDTCTYTITEQEQFVHFQDLFLPDEKEIFCVRPIIYKEDNNQYYFKLQKKFKQEIDKMANDFLLLSHSNDNENDENFQNVSAENESEIHTTVRCPLRQKRESRYAQILSNILN